MSRISAAVAYLDGEARARLPVSGFVATNAGIDAEADAFFVAARHRCGEISRVLIDADADTDTRAWRDLAAHEIDDLHCPRCEAAP